MDSRKQAFSALWFGWVYHDPEIAGFLSVHENDECALDCIFEVYVALFSMLKEERIRQWFRECNEVFDNRTPLAMLTESPERVLRYLKAVSAGNQPPI